MTPTRQKNTASGKSSNWVVRPLRQVMCKLSDEQRLKLLRSKVVKAIFAEQTVDKTNLQYDPEANSYRWVNNRQEKNETKNTSCSICLERFIEGDVVVSSMCTHAFHRDCIMGWAEIKDDCPMCRQSMFDVKTYKMLETEIITMGDAESHST